MRSDQLLHPQCAPVTPLQASTLLLLRDCAPGGYEVLMTRRAPQASFAPGMFVFPGGGMEVQDATAAPELLHQRADTVPALRTAMVAALRETLEEVGVLLAVHTDGRTAQQVDVDTIERQSALWPQLARQQLRLDLHALHYAGQFTAPLHLPKRFDVPFFVARMPEGQTPQPDLREQFEVVWVRPEDAIAAHAGGQMPLMLPTVRCLMYLAKYDSVQAVLHAAAQSVLWQHMPRFVLHAGQEKPLLENDAAYGEAQLVCPDGQVLHDTAWQSAKPVPLRKNLMRLTAPNASVMTGPGTNSYLVGDADTGYIVIDPGPADAAHIQRLFQAAGGHVRYIVCTHSHPDHAPGAGLLQQHCRQSGQTEPLIYGIPSAHTARPDSYFVPDVVLGDGAVVAVRSNDGSVTHTLRAVWTPGHAANHLCLLLQEDALLFTGDHVLNGSTTLVEAPDGNMHAYLSSLDKLDVLCSQENVAYLLPAHGYAMAQPRRVLAQLKAHRLAREAKVLAAMQQMPAGGAAQWVALAYADTPQNLWPLAERSVLAHAERIRALGLLHVTD